MSHPWSDFLSARAKMIDVFTGEGKTDECIALLLSMDGPTQVNAIRSRDRKTDGFEDLWQRKPTQTTKKSPVRSAAGPE